MRLFLTLVAITICLSPAALAQTAPVALAPNEGIALSVAADGDVHVLSRTSTPTGPSPTELEIVDGIRGNPAAMGANVIPLVGDSDAAASQAVEPGVIRMRFLMVRPHDSVLMIENGYDLGLTYHATIFVNDQASPTDVCLVLPSRHGSEHWPYPVDRIELSNLTLTPWRDGDPVPCA